MSLEMHETLGRFSKHIEGQALRCGLKLCRLERMKPWTQDVRFMSDTVNLRAVSWRKNQEPNKNFENTKNKRMI